MKSNENLSGSELIAKLEEISELYANAEAIRSEMDSFVPVDHYERKIQVPEFPGQNPEWEEYVDHGDTDALAQMGKLYMGKYGPKSPVKPKIKEFEEPSSRAEENKKAKLGCLSYGAAGGCIFFLLGVLVNLKEEFSVILTMLVIAAICGGSFVFLKKKSADETKKIQNHRQDALETYNREKEERLAQYQQEVADYNKKLEAIKVDQESFLKAYEQWRNVLLAHWEEEEKIEERLEADRAAAVKQIYEQKYLPAHNKLEEHNGLVAEEYLPVVNILIELLRSGRADDVKEAINLYEEIAYRERQLRLQREQEAQRRHEEERRRQDEERRHQEEMQLRKDQERQRRYDEQERQRKEEQRLAKEKKDREKQERQAANHAKMEAKSRCRWCTNWQHCGVRHDPPLNCPRFDPGSTRQI